MGVRLEEPKEELGIHLGIMMPQEKVDFVLVGSDPLPGGGNVDDARYQIKRGGKNGDLDLAKRDTN